MSKEIKYIILLPLFLFVQVYILNEVMFASYINPYLYLSLTPVPNYLSAEGL